MKLAASDRKALIRLASTFPKGSDERRAILSGLCKLAGGLSPEVRKLNQRFADTFRKDLAEIMKWTYLDDDGDGIALWISEGGSPKQAAKDLHKEISDMVASALRKRMRDIEAVQSEMDRS